MYISSRINLNISNEFIQKLLRLPIRFFDPSSQGEILQKLQDTDRIEKYIMSFPMTIFSIFNLIIFSVILLYFNYIIFLTFFLFSIIYIVWIILFLKKRKEIEFDIREQNIMISKKRFEFLQLQKKIKYRIEEVVQWRQISQRLEKQQTFKNQNYAEMLSEALANKWNNQIKTDKELSDEQRNGLAEQVKMMQELSKQVSIKNQ